MTCRATRRERVLVSRGVHPHYRATTRTYFGGGLELEEIPLVADGEAAGTTDLAALERLLADPDRPVAGRPRRPARLPRPARADAGDRRASRTPPARCSSRSIEPVSLAVLAPPGAYGADIAAGEGQPLGHRAAVRRAVPRHPRLDRRAGPPDPGPPRRDDHRPRRQARVRHDDARARAGHPARQGGQQHLHQPGAARPGRIDLPGDDRAARPARRRGARRRARGRARGGARRRRRRAAPPRPVPQRVRGPRARRAGPSIGGCSSAASWPGLVLADAEPDDPTSPTGCWCAPPRSRPRPRSPASPARSAIEPADVERRRPPIAGRSRPMSVTGERLQPTLFERGRPGPRRRQDPAPAEGRPRPDPGRRPARRPRRPCPR